MDKHSDSANDGNHVCDYGCGANLSDCTDATNDHKCDECSATISKCSDLDLNHKCDKCGEIRRNRAANEAKVQPDDINLLIKLTAGKF